MKIKNWFKSLIAGIAMGISSSIPGVSAGTMAVIFKIYDNFIWALSHIFKEFLKALMILIPIGLGILIGVIPTVILVDKSIDSFLFGLICIFAGFILGSIPSINDEVKNVKIKKWHIITFIISFIIVIGLGVASIVSNLDTSPMFAKPEWYLYLIVIAVGFLASTGIVVPGFSGGMILILLGFYTPLIESTTDVAKECLAGNWSRFGSQFGILMCFLLGILIGFVVFSKIMRVLLNKYRSLTYFGILGFVYASIIALFLNHEIYEYYKMWSSGNSGFLSMQNEIIVGVVLLLVSCVLSYLLVRFQRKQKNN